MDSFTPEKRSEIMSKIRSKDTRPEFIVRKLLHKLGYRFRIHSKALPGKPDIVLKKYRTAIFINGCFWHHHKGCKRSNWPKSNKDYWIPKIKRTIQRDSESHKKLQILGWNVLVIWECETKKTENLFEIIRNIDIEKNLIV